MAAYISGCLRKWSPWSVITSVNGHIQPSLPLSLVASINRCLHQSLPASVAVFVSGRLRQWPPASVAAYVSGCLRQWPPASVAACVSGRLRQWPPASVAACVSGRRRQLFTMLCWESNIHPKSIAVDYSLWIAGCELLACRPTSVHSVPRKENLWTTERSCLWINLATKTLAVLPHFSRYCRSSNV